MAYRRMHSSAPCNSAELCVRHDHGAVQEEIYEHTEVLSDAIRDLNEQHGWVWLKLQPDKHRLYRPSIKLGNISMTDLSLLVGLVCDGVQLPNLLEVCIQPYEALHIVMC